MLGSPSHVGATILMTCNTEMTDTGTEYYKWTYSPMGQGIPSMLNTEPSGMEAAAGRLGEVG